MQKLDPITVDAWKKFLSRLSAELGKETVERWTDSLTVKHASYQRLSLEAKDSFQVLWFDEHIRPRLKNLVDPMGAQIRVSISQPLPLNRKTKPKITTSTLTFIELDPTLTFEEFYEQPENNIVLHILNELCTHFSREKIKDFSPIPLTQPPPNPLYLYGPSGSGKTHLLTATALRLRQAGISVTMARTDLFTDHLLKSIRTSEMRAFRELWRNADVLLVDDVHLLAKKNTTQEEFFHTFNSLHVAGKQIILSANCQPGQLQHIEPRLVSRFEWGLVLPVHSPPKKLFASLLERKADQIRFPLPPTLSTALANLFPSTLAAAMHALEALSQRFTFSNQKNVTLKTIHNLLADLITKEQKSALTPEKILSITAQHFGIKFDDLLGKSQNREFVIPRQIAMYLIRKHLKLPFITIGELFNKNHSTIISAIRHIEKEIQSSDVGSSIASIEIDLTQQRIE